MFQATELQGMPQASLDILAERAVQLGHDVVAVSGFVDEVNQSTQAQLAPMERARVAILDVARANDSIRVATSQLVRSVQETGIAVARSSERIRSSSENGHSVAEWVQTLDNRMSHIASTLRAVQAAVSGVSEIALQVKILAINAKIEAARAGAAGRGFSVVANEINTLSQRTSDATEGIRSAIAGLSKGINDLRDEATTISQKAAVAMDEAALVDTALGEITEVVTESHRAAQEIENKADTVQGAHERFAPAMSQVISGVERTADQLRESKDRVAALIGLSERQIQMAVSLGGDTADGQMIVLAQQTADRISAALFGAVMRGEVAFSDIFDTNYRAVPNTNPQQVVTNFTHLTDRIFPEIQELVLGKDPRIVFCAAVDRNGYLPTHNKAFSAPQGSDPVWNASHSRNRRIFSDRVGLGAGRNTEPFLMQVYRRDMGGGTFVMMKDVSAPIFVKDRHWGGLRLAYRI